MTAVTSKKYSGAGNKASAHHKGGAYTQRKSGHMNDKDVKTAQVKLTLREQIGEAPTLEKANLGQRAAAQLLHGIVFVGAALGLYYGGGFLFDCYMEYHRDDEYTPDPFLSAWGKTGMMALVGSATVFYGAFDKLKKGANYLVNTITRTDEEAAKRKHDQKLADYLSKGMAILNSGVDELSQKMPDHRRANYKVTTEFSY
ncbi:hypothetical protein [Parendozoicomonas sp. Alg238-R29]|uniref:hypothetical protein n=1 Tax=Parendozoicomonas sp. Alg238-R29 TaxID=2993446 RepID=UPI00248EF319|nr:hypothetical protein [Parendozoicomonas sp. Alg238-R29]